MKTRLAAVVSAVWTALVAGAYLWVIKDQGGGVAVPFLALLLVCEVACLIAAAGLRARALLTVALVTAALILFAGLLSVGLLMIPAVIALLIGVLRADRTTTRPQDAALS